MQSSEDLVELLTRHRSLVVEGLAVDSKEPPSNLVIANCRFSAVDLDTDEVPMAFVRFDSVEFENSNWPRSAESSQFIDGLAQSVTAGKVEFHSSAFDNYSFVNSTLIRAQFRLCSLLNVQFVDCDMRQVSFQGARLTGVRFSGCRLGGTSFVDAVLEDVNAVGCSFEGPVLFRSKGDHQLVISRANGEDMVEDVEIRYLD